MVNETQYKLDLERIIVERRGVNTYDFAHIGESDESAVNRAIRSVRRSIRICTANCKNENLDNKYWTKRLKEEKKKAKYGYIVIPFDELSDHKKKILLRKPVTEIPEEQFEYALNVLPPLHYCKKSDIIMFCMREMYTETFTSQYAYDTITEKYYTKLVDCTDASTWIDKDLR